MSMMLITQEMSCPKYQKFKVSDNGEFLDGVFKEVNASKIYGKLIGRKSVRRNSKSTFTSVDIIREGYLWKRGSWIKSWKKRFFIIRRDINSLCYFASKDSMVLLGSIPMENGVYIWKVDPKEADGYENVIAVQPRLPGSHGHALPTERSSSAMLLRGELPTDDLTVNSQALPGGGFSSSWVDDIEAQSEAGISATLGLGGLNLNQENESELLLEELMAAGGDHAWWDVLFNDAVLVDAIGPRTVHKHIHSIEDAALPPSHSMSRHSSNKTDPELSSPGSRSRCISSEIGVSCAATTDATSDDNNPADTSAYFTDSDDELDEEYVSTASSSRVASGSEPNPTPAVVEAVSDVTTPRVPRRPGVSHVGKVDSKKKKVKPIKVEKFSAPPFADATANAYEGNDGLGGLQISVSLQHMVSCQDKIFVVLFGGKKIILPNGNLSVSWSEVSRTELVVVDDHAEYGGSYVENYFYRFSKLQYPIDSSYYDSCTVVMVAVYKVEYSSSVYTSETVSTSIKTILDTEGNGKKSFGAPTLQHHMALCRCILFKDSFRSYRLFSANMDLLIDIPIDISAALLAPPNARLGVCTMHSSQLALKRSIPMLLGSHKPYAETLYCFPSDLGSVMAFEQLTVSKYGVTVASAMLSFLYQERSQLLDNEMEVLKIALHDAFETLESINGDPHAAGVMEFKAHQYELLRNAYNDMLIMQNNFVDDFVGPYYYLQSNCLANNGKGEASVIEPAVGGNYLRRSAWKKNHPWQYCTTNLHFQLFSSQQFGYLDILKQNQSNNYNLVEQENAKPSTNRGAFGNATESFLPTITLGCPCAHSMKFHEGGLLKILTEPGSGYVSANTAAPISGAKPSYSKAHNSVTYNAASRLEWMRLIQSWKSIDGLMQHIKQQRRENCGHVANYLCGGTGDPLTSKETSVQMWLHRTILSKRIDICSSQALGCAVSVVKALCSFADTVGGVYIDILVRSIRAGFLIGFQSFLSTQGAELGMLEDLDCAALWLNLVTVRLVVNSGEVPKENVDKYHSTRARGIGHLLHNSNFDSNGVNIARGRCEEICVRRGVEDNLIVDITLNAAQATAVRKAMVMVKELEIMASMAPQGSTEHGSVVHMGRLGECTYGVNEVQPEVLAVTSFCGVVFSQGVNEMQTLANISGADMVRRQMEINQDSLSRFYDYYKKYKGTLLLQMRSGEAFKRVETKSSRRGSTMNIPDSKPKRVMPGKSSSMLFRSPAQPSGSFLLYPSGIQSTPTKESPPPSVLKPDIGKELLVVQVEKIVDDLVQCIHSTEATKSEKNVNVLIKSSAAIRALAGIVCTLCKSGKDRTSMGVTLDQGKNLAEDMDTSDTAGCIQIMRKYGCRRMNVYASTGQSMFAFNSIQRGLLPACFRPPMGTFCGKVNS